MHYGKSQAIGDKSIFIIDTAMSVVDGRLYYEYCNKGGQHNILSARR